MTGQKSADATDREFAEATVRGMQQILPGLWAFADTADPRLLAQRSEGREHVGQSAVTALLLQEACGGALVLCGNIGGEDRYVNDLKFQIIDLMPDPITPTTARRTGTPVSRERLLTTEPDLLDRYGRFLRRGLKSSFAQVGLIAASYDTKKR